MRERQTARVILLDPEDRILLMKGRLPSDPTAPGLWFTVGGGVEPGESLQAAARREIAEETGFAIDEVGQVLWRMEEVAHDRKGRPVLIRSAFMLARCEGAEPSRAGWLANEREFIDDMRWWSLADLAASGEGVYPPDLVIRLGGILSGSAGVQAGLDTVDPK